MLKTLAYRYYKNELIQKDIEYFKENFDIKLEKVENNLNNKIDNIKKELKSDVMSVSNEVTLLRKDMKVNKIEFKITLKLYNWMFELLSYLI